MRSGRRNDCGGYSHGHLYCQRETNKNALSNTSPLNRCGGEVADEDRRPLKTRPIFSIRLLRHGGTSNRHMWAEERIRGLVGNTEE